MLNKENLRCVELFEKYDLVYSTLKFRLLTAQALCNSNNVQACIKVLEKDPSQEELAHNNLLQSQQQHLHEQELSGLSHSHLLKGRANQSLAF